MGCPDAAEHPRPAGPESAASDATAEKAARRRVDDAEAVYRRYAGDPEVTRFLSFRTHDDVEDAVGGITRAMGKADAIQR